MKYFGTDGIRGNVLEMLDVRLAYLVGKSIAINIGNKNKTGKVIIGKDTRPSGDLISHAISCGLVDYGIDVIHIGIVPTGCVSYLATKLDVGYGIMVTASHNTSEMNGIKIITNLGYKLTDLEEAEIEDLIDNDMTSPYQHKGSISYNRELVDKYINHVIKLSEPLNGLKIAVDTAFGSNYLIAPVVYRLLGAEVLEINSENQGIDINNNCGSQHPEQLVEVVKKFKCDIGFAFDGDADRLVVVLSNGKIISGDELIYLFAKFMVDQDELNSLTVVGTIMTNLGCEQSLNELGIKLVRVNVGDKNIIEKMKECNYTLGGESSGHICLRNYNTTCDALISSLQLLKIASGNLKNIPTMLLPLKSFDSILKSIRVSDSFRKEYYNNDKFLREIDQIQEDNKDVKIVVRPSGTESVIRTLVESEDSVKNNKISALLDRALKKHNY